MWSSFAMRILVGTALKKACEGDTDMDTVHLAEAAKLVKRDMLKM